jgi:hypothetical protein
MWLAAVRRTSALGVSALDEVYAAPSHDNPRAAPAPHADKKSRRATWDGIRPIVDSPTPSDEVLGSESEDEVRSETGSLWGEAPRRAAASRRASVDSTADEPQPKSLSGAKASSRWARATASLSKEVRPSRLCGWVSTPLPRSSYQAAVKIGGVVGSFWW